jgi:hypothetical protein
VGGLPGKKAHNSAVLESNCQQMFFTPRIVKNIENRKIAFLVLDRNAFVFTAGRK